MLLANSLLYLIANVLFLIGSVLSLPGITDAIGKIPGLVLFIVGSVLFASAPVFNIVRAIGMRRQRKIKTLHFRATVIVAGLFLSGSLAFVVGSVLNLPRFPNYWVGWAVTIYVWGSVVFLIATLLAPLKYSWNCMNRSALKRSRSAYPLPSPGTDRLSTRPRLRRPCSPRRV